MKYTKMLGLLVMTVAALMAFAGAASASVATSPAGTTYTGEIHAESENGHVIFHSELAPTNFTTECQSGLQGVFNQHGSGVTPGGPITFLNFVLCTNGDTVVVNKTGTLEAHALGGGNATLTSSGAEITLHDVKHGIKCIYTTNNTDIGTLTGGTPATLDINSATIPRTGGSPFCGTGTFLTGNYKVTKPTSLLIS